MGHRSFPVKGSPRKRRQVRAGARISGDLAVIPLTFGNQSDWSKNVPAAGGCSIRVDGQDYAATEPEIVDRASVGPLLRSAFGPMERASFRLPGIKQYLRLRVVPETGAAPNRSQKLSEGRL